MAEIDALLQLDLTLMYQKEMLTPQEANILLYWKSKCVRDFSVGALAGWAATWKLKGHSRIWATADQILAMDGSTLQKVLANITLRKYQKIPSLMQLISKHFYLERVFYDSFSDNSILRWRYRNFFSYNAVIGRRTRDPESNDKSPGRSENVTDSKRIDLKTKHTFKNASPGIMSEVDPLDCVFGYAPPEEKIHHSNRSHRRSHRRHRMRNHEDLSN